MRQTWIIFTVSVLACVGSAPGAERDSKRGSRSAPLLEAAAAQSAGLSDKQAADARKLYTTKCMRCHKSYDPAEYAQPEWDTWMTKMRKKARLSSEQDDLLSRYLAACRSSSAAAVSRTGLTDCNARSTGPAQ